MTLQYPDLTNSLLERDELITLAKALGENTGLKALDNEKEVKASSNPYVFRPPDAKRRKTEVSSSSPVDLDADSKLPSPQ